MNHYWQALPAESPLKMRYAPPAIVEARYWAVIGTVVLGIVAAVYGAVLLGLLVTVGGLLWGAWMLREVAASQAAFAAWAGRQICLACVQQF
ncbi:hypothetical protein [Streptomyces sp. NPDC056817]|uniref:hypothetical protein n=1 Tax=Streptomyces sp. NPDC056817 TaxID=3345950 RepID=UPI00368D13AD